MCTFSSHSHFRSAVGLFFFCLFHSILECTKNNCYYVFVNTAYFFFYFSQHCLNISRCMYTYVCLFWFECMCCLVFFAKRCVRVCAVFILIVIVIVFAHFYCRCLKCMLRLKINLVSCRISILSSNDFNFSLWLLWFVSTFNLKISINICNFVLQSMSVCDVN